MARKHRSKKRWLVYGLVALALLVLAGVLGFQFTQKSVLPAGAPTPATTWATTFSCGSVGTPERRHLVEGTTVERWPSLTEPVGCV